MWLRAEDTRWMILQLSARVLGSAGFPDVGFLWATSPEGSAYWAREQMRRHDMAARCG